MPFAAAVASPAFPAFPVRSVDTAALGGDSHCQLGAWGSCPDACSCVGNAVDCSYRGLPSVPAEIPVNTEVLWLNDNSIRNVSATALSKYVSGWASERASVCVSGCVSRQADGKAHRAV
nr:variable lymphocyte receptor [Lethenteron reissneri]